MLTSERRKYLLSESKSLIIVVIVAILIRTLIFELFHVPTGSMKATILEGDYLFSTKYNYGYSIYSLPFNPDIFDGRIMSKSPKRGDVIIMRPPHSMDERYIKRLIGMPGEKIQIINNVTYINDLPIERLNMGEYISEDGTKYTKYKEILASEGSFFSYNMKNSPHREMENGNYGPYFISAGHYFFMGDNRDDSGDSRYQLGMVPFRNLIAKAHFVIFSTKKQLFDSNLGLMEQIARIWEWLASIRFKRLGTSLYEG